LGSDKKAEHDTYTNAKSHLATNKWSLAKSYLYNNNDYYYYFTHNN